MSVFNVSWFHVQARDVEEGVVYENKGVTVTAFELAHGPVKPAFGFRVDYQKYSVVLSGDTALTENLIKFSRNTDVIVHETINPDYFRRNRPELPAKVVESIVKSDKSTR